MEIGIDGRPMIILEGQCFSGNVFRNNFRGEFKGKKFLKTSNILSLAHCLPPPCFYCPVPIMEGERTFIERFCTRYTDRAAMGSILTYVNLYKIISASLVAFNRSHNKLYNFSHDLRSSCAVLQLDFSARCTVNTNFIVRLYVLQLRKSTKQ